MYGLLLGAYVIYTLLVVISAVLLLSTGPFVLVGGRVAAKDLQRGFPNAPTVELVGPHAGAATYRIIECADKFCALYRNGEVVTVPVSAISWASSSPAAPDAQR